MVRPRMGAGVCCNYSGAIVIEHFFMDNRHAAVSGRQRPRRPNKPKPGENRLAALTSFLQDLVPQVECQPTLSSPILRPARHCLL